MSGRIGLVAGRYQLQATLAKDGMTTIYVALDCLKNEQVAFKRFTLQSSELWFNSSLSLNDDFCVSPLQELRILSALRHPHIISILDVDLSSAGQPFFTMPLADYGKDILTAAGSLALVDKVALLVQMLRAVAYIHQRGIIHRDLKPAHVLVNAAGQVKVAGFESATSDPIHETGIAGTLFYLSPEVIRGEKASKASDIYAAGLLAYELLAGKQPFAPYPGLIAAIQNGNVDWRSLPLVVGSIVQKMMALDPQQRYPHAEAALEDFCQAVGLPIPEEI